MDTYLHGFYPEEQQRLVDQAGFLAPKIFSKIDFSGCKSLLEIGSGVGAQTSVLLDLYPELSITCVDYSQSQLEKAKEHFHGKSDRVTFVHQDAQELSLDGRFDAVFICWALEHIPNPIQVLQRAKSHLHPGAKVYITEVFNSTFYHYPKQTAVDRFYQAFNSFQQIVGGNPEVGAQLGNLLNQAGYSSVSTWNEGFFLDQSSPDQLKTMLDFWKRLLLSGAPNLLDAGMLTPDEVREMEFEMESLGSHENAVFFYQFVQAFATV
jgi:predicted O-methyltransferase YrrM